MVTVEMNVFELANIIMNNYNYNYSEALAISEFIDENYNHECNLTEVINSIIVYTDYSVPIVSEQEVAVFNASNNLTIVEVI